MGKITYGKATQLNIILGELDSKVLSSTDYISLMRLKNKTSKVVEDFLSMQKEIHADFKIEFNHDGSPKLKEDEGEKIALVNKALEELGNSEVDIEGINFLKMETWDALRRANTLKLKQEEFLMGWVVDVNALA